MACFHPLRAYQCADGEVVFAELKGYDYVRTLELPCGQCIGCRLERSRQWAVRCVHESKLYELNCFITLTYNDEHLPPDGSLRYVDFQMFMRRLRKYLKRPVRFYMCGEYGDECRPHYHACLFGYDFPDKKFACRRTGNNVYNSELLERLWPYGFSSIGAVTMQSAAYIARYCVAKVTGDAAEAHYGGRVPEFNRMSLKPGIGHGWFERFYKDWYPEGAVVVDGKKAATPRYYDKLYSKLDPDGAERLQFSRSVEGRARSWDSTDERLGVREKVVKGRFKFMKER